MMGGVGTGTGSFLFHLCVKWLLCNLRRLGLSSKEPVGEWQQTNPRAGFT